jgi:hypothetical protein
MDKDFMKLVKEVLTVVKENRDRLPEYDIDGNNNYKSLDKEILLLEDSLKGKSLQWFDIIDYENDNEMYGACECFRWLSGEDSTYGEDYLG